ncbi:MAG: hypothetical protein ACRYFZ_02875 [Janthinobacterium lividum]
MPPKAPTTPLATAPKAAETDVKTPVLGEKTPEIVPNQAESVPQNPVPATEHDTPVLIQYSAPEPGPAPAASVASAASQASPATAAVVAQATELLHAVAAVSTTPALAHAGTKVKMLKNHPRVGAFEGTTTTLPVALAAELVADKYAVEVAADGTAIASAYGEPTGAQLAAASAAYGRFLAAGGESEATEFMSPKFEDLPTEYQRCFVAAIDPTYGPQV